MKVEERRTHVQYWLRTKLNRAKILNEEHFSKLIGRDTVSAILTDLIETNAKGFRGVVVTSLAGFSIDKDFNPLVNFYACNPRSIFEQAIWYVLTEYKIPCGKSDPLNVAKNITKLDMDWAKDRRPERAAVAAVKFLTLCVNEENLGQRMLLEDYFYFKLIQYASKIAKFDLASPDTDSKPRQWLAAELVKFSLEAPESGATPQLLVACLLKEIFNTGDVFVCGGDESVFGTNTTSKKPADIWLELNGASSVLFEITLKKIDLKRLEDCIEAHHAIGISDLPLTFICRIPEDIETLVNVKENTLHYKNRKFEFCDYSNFVRSSFSLIDDDGAGKVYGNMHAFVQRVTTSFKAKETWNRILAGSTAVADKP
jgi:hypothetical protein